MKKKVILWIPEDRQIKIIQAIPEQHRAIFWWLKYHPRRHCEAMALHREDFIKIEGVDCFLIQRSVSDKEVVETTKTKEDIPVPCHSEFLKVMKRMVIRMDSPFLFTHQSSEMEGKRYNHTFTWKLWKDARDKVGESINMYDGLKHSTCSQYINEKHYTVDEVQMLTGHRKREMVLRYAAIGMARKKELLEGRTSYRRRKSSVTT
jgi:integrase